MERSLRNGDFLFNFSLLFLLLLLCFVFPRTPKNPDKRYGLFVLRVFHLRRYTQHSIGLAYCVCRKRFRDWRLRTEKGKIRAAFPQRARMSPANRRCVSVFVCVCQSFCIGDDDDGDESLSMRTRSLCSRMAFVAFNYFSQTTHLHIHTRCFQGIEKRGGKIKFTCAGWCLHGDGSYVSQYCPIIAKACPFASVQNMLSTYQGKVKHRSAKWMMVLGKNDCFCKIKVLVFRQQCVGLCGCGRLMLFKGFGVM